MWPSPCGFSKNVFSREKLKPWFFVTFDIIRSHAFPENFIVIIHVVQKMWTIFIDFLDFLTIFCCKKANDVTI